MNSYRIEVFAEGRPIAVSPEVVKGTDYGVAMRRGYALAKPKIRRGTTAVTVRATRLVV